MKPFKCAQKEKLAQARLKMLSTKYVYKSYIYIYIYKGLGIKQLTMVDMP